MRSEIVKKYVIPTIVLAAVIWGFYRYMGGGRELSFSIQELQPMQIEGHMYRGKPTAPKLEQYFFQIRDLSSFSPGEYLTLVTFGTESTVDTLRQFIGTQRSTEEEELEKYDIPGGKYVRIVLDMDAMVRPSPARVRDKAAAFASERGERLGSWNLEIFTSPEELTILFPVD